MPGEYIKKLLIHDYKGETSGRPEFNTAIHASDIISFCPRKFALCRSNKIPYHTKEHVGKSLALTFEIGRKIQDIVVKRIHKTEQLIGTWHFPCCKKKNYGFHTRKCPFCTSAALPAYIDTPLSLSLDKDVVLVGSIDLQVIEGQTIHTNEIKSIKKDEFNKLTEPLLPHQYQLSTYLYLLTHPDTLILGQSRKHIENAMSLKFNVKSGAVIYIPKEAVKDPFDKVFTQKLSKAFVTDLTDKLLKIKKYLNTGRIPKNEMCTSELSEMARGCQVRRLCL